MKRSIIIIVFLFFLINSFSTEIHIIPFDKNQNEAEVLLSTLDHNKLALLVNSKLELTNNANLFKKEFPQKLILLLNIYKSKNYFNSLQLVKESNLSNIIVWFTSSDIAIVFHSFW